METVTHDQEKIARATEEGRVNERDMETVISNALQDIINQLLPKESVQVKMNNDIVPEFMKVEKSFSCIPWIDTSKVLFLEISPLIGTNPVVLFSEATKMKIAGFPEKYIIPALSDCITLDKKEKERSPDFKRVKPYLIPYISEEVDHGQILVTTMDRTDLSIYGLATDIPLNRSQEHQHAHIKSVLILLLKYSVKSVPALIEFDYEITNTLRLNLFICLSS